MLKPHQSTLTYSSPSPSTKVETNRKRRMANRMAMDIILIKFRRRGVLTISSLAMANSKNLYDRCGGVLDQHFKKLNADERVKGITQKHPEGLNRHNFL